MEVALAAPDAGSSARALLSTSITLTAVISYCLRYIKAAIPNNKDTEKSFCQIEHIRRVPRFCRRRKDFTQLSSPEKQAMFLRFITDILLGSRMFCNNLLQQHFNYQNVFILLLQMSKFIVFWSKLLIQHIFHCGKSIQFLNFIQAEFSDTDGKNVFT